MLSDSRMKEMSLDQLSAIIRPSKSLRRTMKLYCRWLEIHRIAQRVNTKSWEVTLLCWSRALRSRGFQEHDIVREIEIWKERQTDLPHIEGKNVPGAGDVARAFESDNALPTRGAEMDWDTWDPTCDVGVDGDQSNPLVKKTAFVDEELKSNLLDNKDSSIDGPGVQQDKSSAPLNIEIPPQEEEAGVIKGSQSLLKSKSVRGQCGRKGHLIHDCHIKVLATHSRAVEVPQMSMPLRDDAIRRLTPISISDYNDHSVRRESRRQEGPQKTKTQKMETQRIPLHIRTVVPAKRTAKMFAYKSSNNPLQGNNGNFAFAEWRDKRNPLNPASEDKRAYKKGSRDHDEIQKRNRVNDSRSCGGITTAESFLDMMASVSPNKSPSTDNSEIRVTDVIYLDDQDDYLPYESPGSTESRGPPREGVNVIESTLPASTGLVTQSQSPLYHPKVQELRKRRREMNEIVNPPQKRSTGLDMWEDLGDNNRKRHKAGNEKFLNAKR